MTTFDGWEVAVRPPEDYLMHFRTKGSKNGVRRYQTESGEWTELGLAERRKREGWGDSKEERKAAKQLARAERHEARRKARQEARAAYAEHKRRNSLKGLSDEEIRSRIERMKLEQEYKEMKKSPVLKAGENFVANYFANKNQKAERAYQEKQTKLTREYEMARLKEQTKQAEVRAKADEERAKADTERAKADAKRAETDKIDIEKGTRMKKLKNEAKSNKLQAKRYHSDYTILGGLRKAGNTVIRGRADARANLLRGVGEARIARKQTKKLNRYNAKNGFKPIKANLPANGYNYVPYGNSNNQNNQNNQNQNQKKKNKKGGTT